MTKGTTTRWWFAGAVLLSLTVITLVLQGAVSFPASAEPSIASATQVQALQGSNDGSVTLTLLHNNDGESKLLAAPDAGFPGIARFAETWVQLGRASDADILLRVSSGDNFLASKELAVSLANDDAPLFDSIALRGLYEAIGFGNHDFDFGPEVAARFIEGFELEEASALAPFVAANVDVSGEPALQALADEGRIAPSFVFTDPTSGLDVGVIGALTPRLANISSPGNVIVDSDVAAAVNAEAETLIADGVNRIVLLSHLQGLGEDQALVPQLSGVDIVVAGGGDELLKNDGDTCQPTEDPVAPYPLLLNDADGNNVPVVTAPGGYRCIGHLEVTFDEQGNIIALSGQSVGVPLDGDREEFAVTQVERPLAAALSELKTTVIGETDVVLDGRRESVRTAASNMGELLADAILTTGQQASDADGPFVAVQNGGGIRIDSRIGKRALTESDTFDIAPFANFVVAGPVSRDTFKEMLEVGVAGVPAAQGSFPQIAGFTVEVDAAQPGREIDTDGDCSLIGNPGARVQSVVLDDGTVIVEAGDVVDGDDIMLTTIDFLAGGGDCYPLADDDFMRSGTSYQQALSTFITDELDGEVSAEDYPSGGSRITITNIDGTDSAESDNSTSDDATAGESDDDSASDDSASDDAAADSAATGDNTAQDDDSQDGDAQDGDAQDGDAQDSDAQDSDAQDGDAQDSDAQDSGTQGSGDDEADDLPNTGVDPWFAVIIAITTAAAGALIFFEARRAGWLSLTNRLGATRAWIPTDDDEQR